MTRETTTASRHDLAALIERLEKATGPDRELDALIFRAIGAPLPKEFCGRPVTLEWDDAEQCFVVPIDDMRVRYTPPNYTASLDAAMTLVPGGWIVEIHRGFDDDGEFWSRVILVDSFSIDRGCDPAERREVRSYGVGEPARFVAAAALKALQAKDNQP